MLELGAIQGERTRFTQLQPKGFHGQAQTLTLQMSPPTSPFLPFFITQNQGLMTLMKLKVS